jgi:trk system potassium uptake protein TrkH
MLKVMGRELSTALRPRQIKKVTVDGQVQDKGVVRSVYGYIFCFISVFVVSILLVSIEGNDLVTNFTAVVAAMGNVGPGLSKVGPTMNYGFLSPLSKIVLIFDMLLGRLEFYPMILLLLPSTWRK